MRPVVGKITQRPYVNPFSPMDVGYFALALCIIRGIDTNESLRYMQCLPKSGHTSLFTLSDVDFAPIRKERRKQHKDRKAEILRYLKKYPEKGVRGCAKDIGVSSQTIVKLIKEQKRFLVLPLFLSDTERVVLQFIQDNPTAKLGKVASHLGIPKASVTAILYQHLI